MTKKELEEIRWIQQDIERVEMILDELTAKAEPKIRQIDGMPFQNANNITDPTGDLAVEIDYYLEELRAYKVRILRKKAEVELWLNDLDDILLKQIIHLRCVELKQWEDIAIKVGGGNTADSCRMYYNRHIK